MYKETPKVILSVNFFLFEEYFVISFIKLEIKPQVMEEVCVVGLKKLQNRSQS